jgi:cephalosporin hydroxylase
MKRTLAPWYFAFPWMDVGPLRYFAQNEQLRFLVRHTSPWTWWRAARRPVDSSDEAWSIAVEPALPSADEPPVGSRWSPRSRWRFASFVRLLWEYARRHDELGICELSEPQPGNPIPIEWRDRLVSLDLANTAIEVSAIARALGGRQPGSILEIGAGYGRTAYGLLHAYPDATYTVVDSAPALGVSYWYLSQLFPPERLQFLTPEQADAMVGDGTVDLALSVASFAELTPAEVHGHLEFLNNVASGGTVYLKQLTEPDAVDDVPLRFGDYPVPDTWQRLFSERCPVQTRFSQAAWQVQGPRAPEIIDRFHRLWYAAGASTSWSHTTWLGIDTIKFPFDLWIYQEIIAETRPDLIIETGTWSGGSALYLASLFDLFNHGEVVTIDLAHRDGRPDHPRITYIAGSSTDPAVFEPVRRLASGKRTMVILDSDHSRDHVAAELDLYSPLVSPGCFLIVEDSNVNGHPVHQRHGPGPMEALERFLPAHPEFEVDADRERLLITWNPSGFLRRRS